MYLDNDDEGDDVKPTMINGGENLASVVDENDCGDNSAVAYINNNVAKMQTSTIMSDFSR